MKPVEIEIINKKLDAILSSQIYLANALCHAAGMCNARNGNSVHKFRDDLTYCVKRIGDIEYNLRKDLEVLYNEKDDSIKSK